MAPSDILHRLLTSEEPIKHETSASNEPASPDTSLPSELGGDDFEGGSIQTGDPGVVRLARLLQNHVCPEFSRLIVSPGRWKLKQQALVVVEESEFVPPHSRRIWKKGLIAGFQGDFVQAYHLLVPRFEDALKYHLKCRKVSIQDERGRDMTLTPLVEHRGECVLKAHVVPWFRWLFCRVDGVWCPDARNAMAHGDIGDVVFFLPLPIYVWWLSLRLAYSDVLLEAKPSPCPG